MKRNKVVLEPHIQAVITRAGKKMRLARVTRGLSASALARKAGLSRYTICKIEKGAPAVCIWCYVLVLEAMGIEDCLDRIFSAEKEVEEQTLETINQQRKSMRKRYIK